ncbi:MAG TPA: DUF4846 domain-containing protein [Clostridiales bacterium]|nr:DUF4846 domain-containing protein [Clostridiales bacterium]
MPERFEGDMKKVAVLLIILILISAAVFAVREILPATGLLSGAAGGEPRKDSDAVTGRVSVKENGTGQRKNSPGGDENGKSADGAGMYDDTGSMAGSDAVYLINEEGTTVAERIMSPEGFERVELENGSFGEFLRNLPLKPHGTKVRFYDGQIKSWDVHAAVIDIDVGDRDLQQCADAVIRLRAEYLYSKGLYDQIHFNFTNGFNAEYKKWMEGYRIRVSGNDARWVKQEDRDTGYASFRRYLDMVFAYAGTLSLSKEMEKTDIQDLKPGDVFLKGGSPGHCVIVVDMAVNPETGEKVFLIAQSYMPAQDIHVLKNPSKGDGDPWYPLDFGDTLITPEWTFTADQAYRFPGGDDK